MLRPVYSLLWEAIIIITTVCKIFEWMKFYLIAFGLWSYDQRYSNEPISNRDRCYLETCRKKITKKPKHLAIIVSPDEKYVNKDFIIRLLAYAHDMGIKRISYFDARKSDVNRVKIEKIIPPKGITHIQLQNYHFQWFRNQSYPLRKASTNGTTCHPLEIFEISECNGQALISEVCRELFVERQTEFVQNLLKDRTNLTEHINNELVKRSENMSEPELGIILGSYTSTFGVLPWQTRFTEFIKFNTIQYFDGKAFAEILCKYSRCEQRWGK